MADSVLFANAIDYVRLINNNVIDNQLARRSSFLLLPSLYQRAFAIVHETGEVPVSSNIIAPDESTTTSRQFRVNVITGDQ